MEAAVWAASLGRFRLTDFHRTRELGKRLGTVDHERKIAMKSERGGEDACVKGRHNAPDRDGAGIIIGSEFHGDTSTGVSLFTTAPLNPR